MSRIGIDLDSTLFIIKAIDIAADELGLNYKEEHNTDYNLQCFPEMLRQKVYSFFNDPKIMCDLAKPIEGAYEKLLEWSEQGHDIILITARDISIGKETIQMVKTYFPMIKDINFVGMNGNKAELFQNKYIDIWVDDRGEDIIKASNMGIKCFLIQNKYTRYNHFIDNNYNPNINIVKCVKDIEL